MFSSTLISMIFEYVIKLDIVRLEQRFSSRVNVAYRHGELCLYRRHNRASVTTYALVLVIGRYTTNTDA